MRTCVYACVPVCVRSVVLLLAVEQNIYYFITLPSYSLSMTDCDCKGHQVLYRLQYCTS